MATTLTAVPATPVARTLPQRVRRILLQPANEWLVIEREERSVADLYLGYIIPLAALTPVATLFGTSVLGITLPFGGSYRVPFASAVVSALVQYALSLAGIYVLAVIIDVLAPRFAGTKGRLQALKVAAYASTASYIAGIVALVPALSVLGIAGLYSLYLIYLGLPVLMRAPRERALAYTATVVGSAIVLFLVAGLITSRFVAYPSLSLPVR